MATRNVERNEEVLACDSCDYRTDNPEREAIVSGDRCPECNEGYLEHPLEKGQPKMS